MLAYEVKLNNELDLNFDEDIIKTGIVKYKDKGKGCCMNYVFKMNGLEWVDEGFDLLELYYERISITEAKKGDIVTTHDTEDTIRESCQHFAKIRVTDGTIKGTIIRSKWGDLGIYEGKLLDLPIYYGDTVAIWHRKYFFSRP